MNFKEALKVLNIEDFGERIFNSNSRGELFHLGDYVTAAQILQEVNVVDNFREEFLKVIKYAEKNLDRPETIFQHAPRIILGVDE